MNGPIADEEVEFLFLDGIRERMWEFGVSGKILPCALGLLLAVLKEFLCHFIPHPFP